MLNTVNLFIALVVAAITYGTPLLFGTLGEVLTEKSGSLNLGVEGIMFMGGAIGLGGVFYYEKAVESPSAFLAVLIGLLCAFIAGGIASLIFSFLTITLRANQNVTGLALTIFGTGVGQYIGEIMRIREGGFVAVGNDLKAVFISSPFPQAMQDIPYVGKILFGNSIFFYLGVVLAIVMHLFLNKSRTGLQLRSVGESPATADAAGINVSRYRYLGAIIGGGISGVSIARELTRQKLDILVVDKECDLALGASGRNDGEVHPGIDLGRGSVKHKYIRRGNAMYDQVCKELDVPFHRVGQYVCFQHGWLRPAVWGYCMWRKYHDGIADTELISGRELLRREPNFNPKTRFAISNPDSGCVCPYGLTIAYAENAVQNGARIALNTAVLGMDVADGQITAVHTNRGTLHPALVINAAGVFAEDVARMADDRFFSIHPRRGTNSILDRKAGAFMHSIASVKGNDMVSKTHSKGGGILHTVHDNLLIGPDAVETYEKENTATHPESIAHVFEKQKITMPALTERDIITYFTGVRAPTFDLQPGQKQVET